MNENYHQLMRCDRKKRETDPEWSLQGLEEEASSRRTLESILKTNGEILAQDCNKIWDVKLHEYNFYSSVKQLY